MAGILNTVYVVAVLLVAIGGVGGVMWLTRDSNPDPRTSSTRLRNASNALIVAAIGIFLIAMAANLLL
ncbi:MULTISPECIES: hypothetical protein [Haloprofundus]|uniref:hypothetical protein n=1 Tax=Haloprofundus TaxID=1911573 RepID=UPI000E442DBF|nr:MULTISPECIES: hypothetical protein [Haloprofundus]QCJ46036.1 hypothetical protein FCF25_02390 [Haloprofundus sp. MHR1]